MEQQRNPKAIGSASTQSAPTRERVVVRPDGVEIELSPSAWALWRAADGTRSASELATDAERGWESLDELADVGLIPRAAPPTASCTRRGWFQAAAAAVAVVGLAPSISRAEAPRRQQAVEKTQKRATVEERHSEEQRKLETSQDAELKSLGEGEQPGAEQKKRAMERKQKLGARHLQARKAMRERHAKQLNKLKLGPAASDDARREKDTKRAR